MNEHHDPRLHPATDERRTANTTPKAGVQTVAILLAAAATAPVLAAEPRTSTDRPMVLAQAEQTRSFAIEAQPLASALARFSEQTGISFAYSTEQVEGIESSGATGELTAEEALQRLLAGTGLEYRFKESGTVTLAAAEASRLEPIEVEAEGGSAYGPVDGYKADRSATALKLDASILDTPAAVQVVSEEMIDDQQATEVREAVRNVSSVQSAGSSGNRSQNLTVRGFDAGRFAKDGFLAPASSGDTGFNDLANVARVEVLKGPASVLYGQTTPGGLVNIVTKNPQPEAFTTLEGTYGSEDFARAAVDFNQPLTEDGELLFRVNASYQDKDSFRDFFVDDERSLVAPVVRWQPTADTTVDVQFEYFDQERQFDRGLVAVGDEADVLPNDRFLGERFSQFQTDGTRFQADLEHTFNDTWSVRTMLRYSESEANRFSADPRGLQADGRTLNRRVADLDQELENFGWQANLQGEFDQGPLGMGHRVLVGVDINETNFDSTFRTAPLANIDIFDPELGAKPGNFGEPGPQDRDIDFRGVYVQDLISIGERWRFLLGGRYEEADTRFARETLLIDTTDEEFSPRVGLVFKPREDTSLYASYSESFDPFVFRLSSDGEAFDPTTGEQFELGVKKEWFGGEFSTTLAAFEITKENILTSDPDNPNFAIQTGEQRSRGVEFDVNGQLTDQWRVTGTVSYLDAEVTEDNEIEEGNRLPNTPDWSASLWAVREFNQGALDGLSLGGGWFFTDDRAGDIENTFTADSYQRVDLFAKYGIGENLNLKVNVNNVFDEDFIRAPSGRTEIVPGAPRQAFARLEYTF